ncbi:hypothetical protein WJX79_007690, partial [Trebouxia sp. C0005]
MNCLSESGTCQAIAQQNPSVKRSRKQHCSFKQITRNVLERVTKRPPASLLHQHQQLNSRKVSRKHVTCHASQLSGPGAWGEAGDKNVVLVADIGGTNCRFVLWRLDLQNENHERLFSKVYPTKDYITFEHALDALASEPAFKKDTPGAAAFACAGPVLDNKCVMTNLDWVIDGASLTMKYGIRMAVLNDFEACGYGVPALQPEDLLVLNNVPARQKGPKGCMGPGTGLGQANLYWSENFGGYRVWPSEGAHASFAPRGWKQRALQTHVERQLGYCEVEHVCCGSGLQRIYEFLQTDEHCARPDLDLTMQKTAAEISKTAIDNSDQLAVEAVDLF